MSVITARKPMVLEPASQGLVEATAGPPFLHELSPAEARAVLDELQAAPIDKLPVDDRWTTVPADVGDVRVRIVRPPDAVGTLPVILYMHGGGWVLGNAGTHDRLVRELAVGTGAAVVVVEYDRSPEARYPVAIEQGYATAQWIVREGAANRLDPNRIAVAGDSVGGNMTAALTLMAQERGDVRFRYDGITPQAGRRPGRGPRRSSSSPSTSPNRPCGCCSTATPASALSTSSIASGPRTQAGIPLQEDGPFGDNRSLSPRAPTTHP